MSPRLVASACLALTLPLAIASAQDTRPYLKLEFGEKGAQDINIEIRGQLGRDGEGMPELYVGDVARFRLRSADEVIVRKAAKLAGGTVVVRGKLSLAPTMKRNYVAGSLLGRRPVVDVETLQEVRAPARP